MPIEIRQAPSGEDADDDDLDDLLVGDGLTPATLVIVHGHHIAALGALGAGDASVATTICDRLRRRGGGALARLIRAADVGTDAFSATLRRIAEQLRTRAEQLGSGKLAAVIDAAAAEALCMYVDAWLPPDELPRADVDALAKHVAIGGEVWGGLGDHRSFVELPILKSGLDPAAEPALEVDVTDVPPLRASRLSVRLRRRTVPDEMLGDVQTLRLVRRGTLMVCHAVDSQSATFDEATQTLGLELGDADG